MPGQWNQVQFGDGLTVTQPDPGVIRVDGSGGTGPAGPTGPTGPAGPTGPTGAAGPGVPVGGTTGQVLEKNSGTDYDTIWATPTGGGGGGTGTIVIGYDQITAAVTVTGTSESAGTTVIAAAPHTFDGTPVIATFFAPLVSPGSNDFVTICLFEGSTEITRLAIENVSSAGGPVTALYEFTPTAGSHTYTVTALRGTASGTIYAGPGGTANQPPAFLRFTRASGGGATGPAGPTGPGVPTGGTTGQILAKTSGADYATAWVAQLDITGKVDKDSVTAAATRLVQSMLVAGDTQPAFKITGDGKHSWGTGGSTAPDTFLYRSAAAVLQTDGTFAFSPLAATAVLKTYQPAATPILAQRLLTTDTAAAFTLSGDGSLHWGPGGATNPDTHLNRAAAQILQTPSQFQAGNGAVVLGTDGHLDARYYVRANAQNVGAAAGLEVLLGYMGGAAAAIQFGTNNSWDTNLYRSAAATLKTDGNLIIAGLGGSSQLVQVGANDSGGTGYRMLRVPN
jgi:hypothetical protein